MNISLPPASLALVNATWEQWQSAPFVLIPVVLIFALHGMLFIEHLTHVASDHWRMRFQALYMRLTGFFPTMAVLTLIGTYYPAASDWLEFVFGVIEAYILAGFVAIMFGLAHQFIQDVPAALMNSSWSNKPQHFLGEFSNGKQAMAYFKYTILQFSLVKPLCTFIAAAYSSRNQVEVPENFAMVLRVIQAVSILWAVHSLIRCHQGLVRAPEQPFQGHAVFAKLVVMKSLFGFIFFNNLIVRPLIDSERFPVQAWVCTPEVLNANASNANLCQYRLLFLVFLFELFILNIPILFLFRHHALTCDQKISRTCAAVGEFMCRVLWIFDLQNFWNGKLAVPEDSAPISKTGMDIGGMHSGGVAPTAYNNV